MDGKPRFLGKIVLPLLVTLLIPVSPGTAQDTGSYYLYDVNPDDNYSETDLTPPERYRPKTASSSYAANSTGEFDGINCFLPYEITIPQALPVHLESLSSCGLNSDYSAENMCSEGGYGDGEDFVFELQIDQPIFLRFALDPKGTPWSYFEIRTVCFPPAGQCIANYKNTEGTKYQSKVLLFQPGVYYVIVDTWPGPSCVPDFDFYIDQIDVQQLTCPEGAEVEEELLTQRLNDGCAMEENQNWIDIECGTTFCGRAWADFDSRDTDWYEFTIGTNTEVTWTGVAEFSLALFIMSSDPDCRTIYVYDVAASNTPNTEISCTAVLTPGTYWLWAGPADFAPTYDGYNDYQVTLTCKEIKEYCYAEGDCDSYIGSVIIGDDFYNESGCEHYASFTENDVPLLTGTTVTLNIENGNPQKDYICGVWVDWNRNFQFETIDQVVLAIPNGYGPYFGYMVVPPSIADGWYRMRIRLVKNDLPQPCGFYDLGEVEDFKIRIGSPPEDILGIVPAQFDWTDTSAENNDVTAVYLNLETVWINPDYFEPDSTRLNGMMPDSIKTGINPANGKNSAIFYLDANRFVESYGTIWEGETYFLRLTGYEALGGYFALEATVDLTGFMPGDVNDDAVVDMEDIVYLIQYKFVSGPAPYPFIDIGDVNGDGIINIRDIIYLVSYSYGGGPAPVHP